MGQSPLPESDAKSAMEPTALETMSAEMRVLIFVAF
jgi:hypothetical protein